MSKQSVPIIKMVMPTGTPRYILDPADNLCERFDEITTKFCKGVDRSTDRDRTDLALGFVDFLKSEGYEFVTEYWMRKNNQDWGWRVVFE